LAAAGVLVLGVMVGRPGERKVVDDTVVGTTPVAGNKTNVLTNQQKWFEKSMTILEMTDAKPNT